MGEMPVVISFRIDRPRTMAVNIDIEKGVRANEAKQVPEGVDITYALARQITVPGDSVPAMDLQAKSVVVEGREGCVVLLGCILMAVTNMGCVRKMFLRDWHADPSFLPASACVRELCRTFMRGVRTRIHRRVSYPWWQVYRLW
jgi:hypothetical protein